jgi:hypothetical protein
LIRIDRRLNAMRAARTRAGTTCVEDVEDRSIRRAVFFVFIG